MCNIYIFTEYMLFATADIVQIYKRMNKHLFQT